MAEEGVPHPHRYVGRIIHVMRKERGLRQAELAALTGLKQPNLSRIENGLVVPRPTTLQKVATALDVQLKDLLSEEKVREVEAKWRASLSPRNAGQLFNGQITAVPIFSHKNGYAAAFDSAGQPGGKVDVTLQLLPIPGQVFGLRAFDDSMLSSRGQACFNAGDILIFSDQPPVKNGDFALVHTATISTFRQVFFSEHPEKIQLAALNERFEPIEVEASAVLKMWRLARRIQEF